MASCTWTTCAAHEPPTSTPPVATRSRPSSPSSPSMASATWRSTITPANCPPWTSWLGCCTTTCPGPASSSAPTRWSTSCSPTSRGGNGATSSPCPPTARSATSASAGSPTPRSSPRPPAATPTCQRSSPAGCATWSTGRTPTARSAMSPPWSRCDREGAPAWGDAGVIIPWHLWRTYGDRLVLERSFDAMGAWVAHIRRHNPDLRWRHRTGNSYGDWLQVDVTTPRRRAGHRILRAQRGDRGAGR